MKLSAQAMQLRERALQLRLQREVEELRSLEMLNPGRARLEAVAEVGGRVFGLALTFDLRTCTREPGAEPVFARHPVCVQVDLGEYPALSPQVVLHTRAPLFLPGVATVARARSGECIGIPCLFRNVGEARDLRTEIDQLVGVLTAEPAILNSPTDCLNPTAAEWLLQRGRGLLPLDRALLWPESSSPVRETLPPQGRFELEAVDER